MSEEEYMECSVVAYPRHINFLHINGGIDSYYVDRHVSDYVARLQQENQKYKEVIDKIFNYLEDNYGYSCVKGIINDTDVSKLYDILKEVE